MDDEMIEKAKKQVNRSLRFLAEYSVNIDKDKGFLYMQYLFEVENTMKIYSKFVQALEDNNEKDVLKFKKYIVSNVYLLTNKI